MPKEPVFFDNVEVLHETEEALLLNIDGEEVWIPQSQIADESEVYSLETSGGTLAITEWIAIKKGLV